MVDGGKFTSGDIVRADFFWRDRPRNDGKERNCVVLRASGRRAIIAPITTEPPSATATAIRIPDAQKHGIDRLDDKGPSWVVASEQNAVYTDGPRLKTNDSDRHGDPRIFGRVSPGLASRLLKAAQANPSPPYPKQAEEDWRKDLDRYRAKTREDERETRVKAAAERLRDRKEDRPKRPRLGLKKRDEGIR